MVSLTTLIALLAGPFVDQSSARSGAGTSAQLVAKLFSEALGRMPDPTEWLIRLRPLNLTGCDTTTVAHAVRAMYTSAEFADLPYGHAQRVLALYRGALNRDPDQGGIDYWTAELDGARRSWTQVIDEITASAEFAALVPRICGATAGYHFGGQPAPELPVVGPGLTGPSAAQLQAALNSAPAGGTVYLARSAVVRLDSTLVIPAGKTLATVGRPPPGTYALQGRLVRTASFAAPMVRLDPGARLTNVWVDGQRGDHRNYTLHAINVQVLGGDGSEVSGSKITDSQGWTSVLVLGTGDTHRCDGATVSDNLVTAYPSEHQPVGNTGLWTDGLSISCENATVENNGVIDATDVGIVVFRALPAVQSSLVRGNQILNAGNSAYGAIAIDGLYDAPGTPEFSGTRVVGNTFWTGPRTHLDIGLAVGTQAWFGSRSSGGSGASVTGNTTGTVIANVGTGIAVGGMDAATVTGNDLRLSVQPVGRCPSVAFGVDPRVRGGQFRPAPAMVRFTDDNGDGCIGHIF